MSTRLLRNLLDLVSGAGRTASLKELRQSGVDSVRLLGADQLAALVERSLDRVLEQRVLELTDYERSRMLERAQEEFETLRAQIQGLETDAERKRRELTDVESRLGGLSADFQKANATLDAEILAAMRHQPAPAPALDDEIEQLLPVIRDAGVSDAALAERVARAVAVHIRRERDRIAAEQERLQRERVEMLERRLAKLNETLAKTEEDLQLALANAGSSDDGVSSIYRTVQGLHATARDFKRKRAMLSEIFEKNLILQKGASAS